MSTVDSLTPVFTGQTSAQNTSSSTSAPSQEISKSEFLRLLVEQLKNQDPLNPINNEDFIAQLATFSSLEQLISINQAVSKLAGISQGTGSADENQSQNSV